MTTLLDLEIFVRTADSGSFSAAARSLGLTPAAASLSIKRLEKSLGIALLVRSTRSLRLTEEGRHYLDSVRLALGALSEAEQALGQQSSGLSGTLQLTAPSDFGRNVLLPWLDEFRLEHPHLRLNLRLNDRNTDLIREPVDLALRYGVPNDSSLVALPVVPEHRRVACASPEYLARHGCPASPLELEQHKAVLYRLGDRRYDEWRFSQGDMTQEVGVRGELECDDGEVARRWALAGHGIVYKAQLDVQADLRGGRLIALFPDWQGERVPLNLLCPQRAQVTERVRLLQQFLRHHCNEWLSV